MSVQSRNTIHIATVLEKLRQSLCLQDISEHLIRLDLFNETRIEYSIGTDMAIRWIFIFNPISGDEEPSELKQCSVTDDKFLFWLKSRHDSKLSHGEDPVFSQLSPTELNNLKENVRKAKSREDYLAGMKGKTKKKFEQQLARIEELQEKFGKRKPKEQECPI